jgi:hypothetical protein
MKKGLLIIGIVFGIMSVTVSQTKNSENTSTEREHCFSEEEYQGILDMYYEVKSLDSQVMELKHILGIKDSALTLCVEDYTYMEETLSMVSDSLSSYKADTRQIKKDLILYEEKYQKAKIVAITSSIGVIITSLLLILI